jgi:DNA-binding transcriptional MerR regulator
MQPKLNNETLQIPAKLYRIGELVSYTPFSRQTIHNYTIMGLIQEAKWTEGGHRLYDESVFERLSEIIRLRKTKTLSEIREALRKKDGMDSQFRNLVEKGRIEHESDVTFNG